MGLFIKNGMLVTSEKTFSADILIENGKISRIEKPGTVSVFPDKVIDALGMLVFPGGIDPHVHMHLPTSAGFSSDDFLSGSRAALFGGTTTLIDFVTPHKGENLCKALEKRKAEAKNCFTDYAFHVSPVEWRPSLPEEIRACIKSGTPSFKVYMAYKDSIGLEDEDLQKVFQVVAEAGGMVTAHCELGDEIENLRNDFVKNGRTTPEYHPLSRPARLEAAAIKKALDFARRADCPFYIVHVSAAASLVPIRQAQKRGGQRVFAESCPHYLLLDDSRYQGNFQQTAPFVLSPPLRKKADNSALWEALADGTIQSMGTDHCPFTMEQKRNGLHDFRKIANGAGSVEHRLKLLYTYGVVLWSLLPHSRPKFLGFIRKKELCFPVRMLIL